jgi:hypothetical protein
MKFAYLFAGRFLALNNFVAFYPFLSELYFLHFKNFLFTLLFSLFDIISVNFVLFAYRLLKLLYSTSMLISLLVVLFLIFLYLLLSLLLDFLPHTFLLRFTLSYLFKHPHLPLYEKTTVFQLYVLSFNHLISFSDCLNMKLSLL